MLNEPYRWVEAIANRREYIDEQLKAGSPVVGLPYDDGILIVTVSRGQRKVFEIYDRLALSAIGHPADIEKLRMLATDAAHLDGFNRSSADVTLHRLVNFIIGPAIKQSFDEGFRSPYIIKMLMAELGDNANQFYVVNYDGTLRISEEFEVLAGTGKAEEMMKEKLTDTDTNSLSLEDVLKFAKEVWAIGRKVSLDEPSSVDSDADSVFADEHQLCEFLAEELKNGSVEAAVLQRSKASSSKFQLRRVVFAVKHHDWKV